MEIFQLHLPLSFVSLSVKIYISPRVLVPKNIHKKFTLMKTV